MKVWYGYGSEHSMNLVMIGHFKSEEDARKTKDIIDTLIDSLTDKIEPGVNYSRFDDEVLELLMQLNVHGFTPNELEQFLYDHGIQLDNDKLIITTEESDVSVFSKLMIDHGANIEMYSAHHYPGTGHGR